MSATRIATRYAKSLVDLAKEQNKLDRIKEDVATFQSAVENRDFELLLKSPIINAEKKKQVFNALFKDSFDEMTFGFLNIVLSKNRESNLPEIADSFMNQYKAINKVSEITLTTATPLSDDEVEKIKANFLKSSETRDNIEVNTKVDPAIIGGFVVEFDDKLYDASVAHKLEQLKKEFLN